MKRFLPRASWCALVLAAGAASAAMACGDSESPSPVSTSSSSGSGGAGTGGSNTGGTAGSGGAGGVTIEGISGPVDVVQDEFGVVHIAGKADDDVYAALGYMHAKNRFFFMDFVRNSVRGKLAALVKAGDTVLSADYTNRQFFTTRQGTPLESALFASASSEVKGIMESYTAGVNAWIADMRAGRNGATLTTEYDFSLIVKSAIRDWEPEDSAAVGLYVLNDLSNDSQSELAAAAQVPLFTDPTFAADLFSTAPVFDAFTLPAANTAPASHAIGQRAQTIGLDAIQRLAPHQKLFADAAAKMKLVAGGERGPKQIDTRGSNNWVAGPSRTHDKKPLLANDPHLLLGNPSIWFPVELDAKSNGGKGKYHVEGSTFPGLPSVMIGHNESIAWGVTTAYYDLDDVYLEQLSDDNKSVKYKGSDVALVTKSFDFVDSRSKTTITQSFSWVPHHGPLITTPDGLAAHTAISIRWRGQDAGGDLDAFFGMAKATSVADAKNALQVASSANQNFVVVDKQHIAYYPYSKVADRSAWASMSLPPWLPLPGDGSAEWGDPIAFTELPQLEDPALGAIATANNDMTGSWADGNPFNADTYPAQKALQSAYKADGTREQRILDRLAAGGNDHTVDTFVSMQGDTYSLYGKFTVDAVKAAVPDASTLPADQKAIYDALAAWQLTCPTGLNGDKPDSPKIADAMQSAESIGCTAGHTVFYAIVTEAIGDEITAAHAKDFGYGMQLVARALAGQTLASGDALWDDVSTVGIVETKNDIVLRALARAATSLAAFGATSDDWRWGKAHTLTLSSIFQNFGITTYNYGPLAAPGGLFTVNVGDPGVDPLAVAAGKLPDFSYTSGPSVRFVAEVGDKGPTMKFQLPGGEDLHHDSKFYNNLVPNWLHDTPVDFYFGPGAVKNPADTFEITPAKKK